MTDKHPAFGFLGYHVEELTTGIKGYVTQISEHSSGLVQCSVQPKGDGTTNPDPWSFDVQTLKKSDTTEFPPIVVTPFIGAPHPLKADVKVDLTGFRGKISQRCYFINGCVGYSIVGPDTKEGKTQERFKLHEGVIYNPPAKPVEATPTPPVKRTGGPSTRAVRL